MDAVHKPFGSLNQFCTRNLNRVFGSAYNPFHISGTLTIALLLVLIVTGIYLLFLYSVSDPYGSLVAIQQQAWLGRWVRALHRYATDAAILFSLFHFFQVFAQGKTWGPRTLAWVSGLLLMGSLLVSTWTGYVMIWDRHGQMLAEAGLEVLQPVSFLGSAIKTVFSGESEMTGSFFFMNLFLHVAVPLAMFIMIWIHTSRLRDGKWLPKRRVFLPFLGALMILSIFFPAPMTGEADLLKMTGRVQTDWFSYLWVAPFQGLNSYTAWAAAGAGLIAFLVIPWWYQPGKKEQKPSFVNPETCTGCKQCFKDCPFEAIEMLPRNDGTRKLYSHVQSELCVSCGICAASCNDFAIGPPGRKGFEFRADVERFLAGVSDPETRTLIYYCRENGRVKKSLEALTSSHPELIVYPVACAGNLHAKVVGEMGKRVKRSAVWACEMEACLARFGAQLAWERLTQKRQPSLPGKNKGGAEVAWFEGESVSPVRNWLDSKPVREVSHPLRAWAARIAGLGLVTAFLFLLSTAEVGTPPKHGVFRILLTIPGEVVENRQAWGEAELKGVPKHMRPLQKIERKFLAYTAVVAVDGQPVMKKPMSAGRIKKEGVLRMEEDFVLNPGRYRVQVSLFPEAGGRSERGAEQVILDRKMEIRRGEIHLFAYNPKKNR